MGCIMTRTYTIAKTYKSTRVGTSLLLLLQFVHSSTAEDTREDFRFSEKHGMGLMSTRGARLECQGLLKGNAWFADTGVQDVSQCTQEVTHRSATGHSHATKRHQPRFARQPFGAALSAGGGRLGLPAPRPGAPARAACRSLPGSSRPTAGFERVAAGAPEPGLRWRGSSAPEVSAGTRHLPEVTLAFSGPLARFDCPSAPFSHAPSASSCPPGTPPRPTEVLPLAPSGVRVARAGWILEKKGGHP